jgi:hypothetical protein
MSCVILLELLIVKCEQLEEMLKVFEVMLELSWNSLIARVVKCDRFREGMVLNNAPLVSMLANYFISYCLLIMLIYQ